MKKSALIGLFNGVLVALLVFGYGVQAETDRVAAVEVMNTYLESLANGDAPRLSELIDGAMKKRNRQLTLDPDYYGEYLRAHYSGVIMSVESIRDKGERVEAAVRFDYPSAQSTTIIFVLSQVAGEWKITDELF